MKKATLTLLLLCALLMAFGATAEVLPSVMNRNVPVNPMLPNNPEIPGESMTTGLPKSDDRYAPILMQVDNNPSALPHFGIGMADIMYEMPIQGLGWTRLTALFSDQYPNEAGPVRSGRVMHADLREEWDAAFAFYGKQEVGGSDLRKSLRDYGVNEKGLAFDGIGNKYEPAYFYRTKYHKAPHNVAFAVQKAYDELVAPLNYPFPKRPFLFTDEKPTLGVEAGKVNIIHKGNVETSSSYVYNAETNTYTRYTEKGPYVDLFDETTPIQYANIIVMRTRLTWNVDSMSPLLPDVIGQGAAEIFTGGRYIPGAWARATANSRTIFFDSNGDEIKLQRGKTWICVTDSKSEVSIDAALTDVMDFFKEAKKSAQKTPYKEEPIDQLAAMSKKEGVQFIMGPEMNVPFEFAKAPKSAVVQYYTPIRLKGFEPTVYAFNDKQGVTQFRVYGRIPGGSRGFYALSVTPYGKDPNKPYLTEIISDKNLRDQRVFMVYTGGELDASNMPTGFNKGQGKGIYTFTNLFGKPENLAYASADGTNYAWYFVNVKRPLAGSLEVDMDDVMTRMAAGDGTLYTMPADMKGGYARKVKIKTTDGQIETVYTDYPVIDQTKLTKK